MARKLRPVGLEFVETAPIRLSFTALVGAAPGEVYGALADETEAWPAWFSAVTSARPTAAGREVRLKGGIRFDETVVAAEPGVRYAYRIDTTNAPGVSAMLEEWLLTPVVGGGTRVRWTMAVDGPAGVRAAMRLARPGVASSFRSAAKRLGARLAGARL
ncbi:SRPBCC family protein [Streptomyces sp. NPDC050504]|uniref:SRPBCC family protein n=1 Tax=Streptomyces sp. NPDC050504 TaxID=3365618 RepID=UPI00379970A9